MLPQLHDHRPTRAHPAPRLRPSRLASAVLALTIAGPTTLRAQDLSFNRDVRPILSSRCFSCHGPDADGRKAQLRLDRADGDHGAYRSRDDAPAIAPGSPEKSELWRRITATDPSDVMPPPDAKKEPLSDADRAIIRRWIEAGATFDTFWSFTSVRMPPIPAVANDKWSHRPIDRLVLNRLEREEISPSREADKRTLIRRVTFDLTGLPPTRDEIDAFLSDTNPNAYESLVDGLLARPQYGEHMTRYWLDLVRFADTNGMHKDFYRNFIAYRDWVIRAFNSNVGYDDFIRYQLAGDLFPNATDDQLVASGFNRLHLIIDRGTALPEESFFKNVVDRVTSVGTSFMGLTVQCASCHDHKYDPLTRKDFYSLFAFFNNIDAEPETRGAPRNGLQPPIAVLGTPEQKRALRDLDRELARLGNELDLARKAAESATQPDKKQRLAQEADQLNARKTDVEKRRQELDQSLPRAMVMKERAEVRPSHIMKRGQYDAPGEPVTRNTPEFLPPLTKRGDTATRLDLAEWFVDRDNPLTARVAVNRFWQQFFGVGIVKTSEDLGSQGERPSHPELLDYLAASFVESGWDVKALVREIVLTKTYRQSSLASPAAFRTDPDNRLLARGSRFRLDAEMIRDQILSTSGLLSRAMYGRSVKPPQPDGLWKAVTMIGERFRPDVGDAIYRRSVYTYWKRGMPPPQMTILNAPIRDACLARRERTNTPSQALLLLNENQYLEAAKTLALRVLARQDLGTLERVDLAYEIVTSKLPDDRERGILSGLIGDLRQRYENEPTLADELCGESPLPPATAKSDLAAWTVFVNTLYNLDITKTRE